MSALPAVRGLSSYSIEAVSRPARTFTGDFYFTHKAEDRLWLAQQCRNRLNLNGKEDAESGGNGQSSLDFGPMTGVARAILAGLKPDAPVGLDALIDGLSGNSPSEIIATLFELEINGLVRQLPGKSFLRVWLE